MVQPATRGHEDRAGAGFVRCSGSGLQGEGSANNLAVPTDREDKDAADAKTYLTH